MRLRCLGGRYAGQIQDYSPFAAQAALRTGMAERLDAPRPVGIMSIAAPAADAGADRAPVSVHAKRKSK